jgi:ABC-2 type transport system permease protein
MNRRKGGAFLRKYLPFTRGAMEEYLTYRFRFVFWLLFEFFYLFIAYFLWKGVFGAHAAEQGVPFTEVRIGNYDFSTMVLYIFFERIVFALTSMQAGNYMEDDIQQGNIAMRLIKPLNYRIQLFFQSLGSTAMNALVFSVPFGIGLIVYASQTGMSWAAGPVSVLFFFLSLVLGAVINYLISFAFGLIIFLTINSFGMWQLKDAVERVFTGNLIPIALFPVWLRTISTFLPFAQTRYVPILFILGTYENDIAGGIRALGLQVIWIAVLFVLTSLAWNRATRRIVVQGG